MFERFTKRSRKAVVLAQEEARHFSHNYIGTEHLLLGLLRGGDSVAAHALASLDVTLGEVREQVQSIIGYGEGATNKVLFTPRSKKVFELALREALQCDHSYIATEHLLLGLMREGEGVANRILDNLDVEEEKVRREVLQVLDRSEDEGISNEELWESVWEVKETVNGSNRAPGSRLLETTFYATLGSMLSAPVIGVTVYAAVQLALKKTLQEKGSRSIFRR